MSKMRSKSWRNQLLAWLSDSGWERTAIDDDTDWWVDEHWTISSVRQNYGLVLILNFLVFPYSEGAERSTTVWLVTATTRKPAGRDDDTGLIAEAHLQKGHFNENLKTMVEAINRFRDSHE
jgi:hypothetical protein